MKKPLIFGIIIALFVVSVAIFPAFRVYGSSRPDLSSVSPAAELDFDLVGGRIYLPAEINGHKVSVILDSGAGSSVMDLALANQWGLSSSGEFNANGVGAEVVKGKFLTGVNVSIGNISEPVSFAMPLGPLNKEEGRPLEIIFGAPFLQKHIVEIDYASRHLRIFDDKTETTPPGENIPLRFVDFLPHINLEMILGGVTYQLEGMIDTGASRSGVTAKFLKSHPLGDIVKTEKTIIGGGAGGDVEGRFFRADTVRLGSFALAGPDMTMNETTGGVEGTNAKYDINISSEFLQRFKVTFDYPHNRIFLEPNETASNHFEVDKTGMRIYAEGNDLRSFRIVGVLRGSASDQAGIKINDIIETVDGAPASKFTLNDLRELFRSATIQKWELGIRRGDSRQLTIIVPAKSII